jgi:hypothetical protein
MQKRSKNCKCFISINSKNYSSLFLPQAQKQTHSFFLSPSLSHSIISLPLTHARTQSFSHSRTQNEQQTFVLKTICTSKFVNVNNCAYFVNIWHNFSTFCPLSQAYSFFGILLRFSSSASIQFLIKFNA